jgi:hypothetical protein
VPVVHLVHFNGSLSGRISNRVKESGQDQSDRQSVPAGSASSGAVETFIS